MECELKYALPDEAAYDKLRASLGPPQAQLQQTNLYLEGPISGLLAQSALRLRLERNLTDGTEKRVLTYKQRSTPNQGAYHTAEEYEVEVDQSTWDSIAGGQPTPEQWQLEPLRRYAEANGALPLKTIGTMANVRWTYPLPDGSLAEVDRTQLPGDREDFELEVETEQPEPVEAWLRVHFQELGLELTPQPSTKFRRFLEQLR